MDAPLSESPQPDRAARARAAAGACVLAAAATLCAVLLLQGTGAEAELQPLDVSALPEPVASCPEGREHALHAAQGALHAAEARLQRYAFAPRDGRNALARLAEAVECARLAEDAALLARATARRAELRARIERDVRDHARRYELLRKHGRTREAADAILYLSELGWPERGAFAERLQSDRERLEAEASEGRP